MKNIVSGIIGLLFIFTCQAQNLYFKHLGIADGLSQVRIQTIYQDEIGAVWLGTSEGLNRYNGTSVSTYAIPEDFQTFPQMESIKYAVIKKESSICWHKEKCAASTCIKRNSPS